MTEGTAAEFTVTLSSAAPSGGVTVNLTVSDADSSDFVASGDEGSKSVTIAQGETSAVYRLPTVADSIDEPNDSVSVALASGSGYTLGGTTSASVIVNDDDVIWRATLTAGEFTGRPPRTGYSHSDSIGSLTDSTFAYGTSQGRWDDIVLRKNGRFVMSGVRTSGPKVSDSFKVCVDGTPFEFNPLGADDLNEVAYWTTPYTNLAWTPGRKVRMELIKAADTCAPVAAVSLSASPNPVAEGSPVTVTATLSKALASTVTIPLTLARGTAEVDDFGPLASIAIPAGSTAGTGTITTTNDEDTDIETFAVALGDTLPFPVVVGSPDSVEVTIADGGLSTLNNLQVDPVDGETTELDVSWDAYTARGPLVYVVQWKTGTEEYGDTTRMFTTALDTTSHRITDLAAGTTYSIQVTGNSAFGGLGVAQAETTGTTYAATVSLSASPNPVNEGSPVTVTATLSGALEGSVDDIGALASITIAADSTTGTGRITTSADSDAENETFTVALGDTLPSSLTPDSASSVTVTITDTTSADVTPTFGDATVLNQSYPVDTWIEELQLPVATSGNGTLEYTLEGPSGAALPAGLSFTAGDRSLSGTPTTVQTATTYTYKATDRDDDFATLTFTIEVTALGDVLVSNVNKRPGGAVAHLKLKDHGAAQAFTTGSNAAGYTLTGVQLRTKVGTLRAPVFTVAIHTSVNGAPGSPVDTLTAPAAVAPGVNAFTHAGLALDADTTYFVVIEARDTTPDRTARHRPGERGQRWGERLEHRRRRDDPGPRLDRRMGRESGRRSRDDPDQRQRECEYGDPDRNDFGWDLAGDGGDGGGVHGDAVERGAVGRGDGQPDGLGGRRERLRRLGRRGIEDGDGRAGRQKRGLQRRHGRRRERRAERQRDGDARERRRLHAGRAGERVRDGERRRRSVDADGEPVGLAEPGGRGFSGDGDGDAVGGAGERCDDSADAGRRHGRNGRLRFAREHRDKRRLDHGHGPDRRPPTRTRTTRPSRCRWARCPPR